jgi:hypothetical protein
MSGKAHLMYVARAVVAAASYAYRLAALKVEADLDLPDLSPWDGPSAAVSDIVIRLGEVPSQLQDADCVEAIFQTRGRDEYLLTLPGTGRVLVRCGREITIEPERDADPINMRALLTGPIQAVLWHQRGLLPLQASAVVIGGRAVALAGPAAAGKSAFAAVLAQAGHEILADDLCVIEADAGSGSANVLPGVTQLRLWRDTLDQLGIAANGCRPALSDKENFLVDCWVGCREKRPLAAVFALARQSNVALTVQRLSGMAAMNTLREVVHMRRPASALGCDGDIAAGLSRLSRADVPVWRLSLPDDPACLPEARGKILRTVE